MSRLIRIHRKWHSSSLTLAVCAAPSPPWGGWGRHSRGRGPWPWWWARPPAGRTGTSRSRTPTFFNFLSAASLWKDTSLYAIQYVSLYHYLFFWSTYHTVIFQNVGYLLAKLRHKKTEMVRLGGRCTRSAVENYAHVKIKISLFSACWLFLLVPFILQ